MNGRRSSARRVVLTVLLMASLSPPAATAAVVLESGHVDAIAPTYDGSRLTMRVKDGTVPARPVIRDPAEVLFRVKREAQTAVRAGLPAAYAFLGAPGSTIWLLPQVQSDNPAVVWAGWSSESIAAGQFAGDQLRWQLVAVDGPGPVQLYENDPFGAPRVIFDSADGQPDVESKPTGAHAHFNWVFHAAGVHRIWFEVSGTPAGSPTPISTGAVEYRFEVIGWSGDGAGGGSGGGGSPPGDPTGDPGGGQAPSPAVRLGASVRAARLKGRRLTMRFRVTRESRAAFAVLREGRVLARSRDRTIGAGVRRLRVRLDRRLTRGRYRVRVTVRSGDDRVVRRVPLHVRAR